MILPNHRHTIIPDFFAHSIELICPYNSVSNNLFDLNVHPFTIIPYCFQDFSVLTNYEIGKSLCPALSIISYKLLETFLRHTLPIRNKPITVFALYDFSIKHQSSKLVTLHCWSPKCSVQRYFYKSGNT